METTNAIVVVCKNSKIIETTIISNKKKNVWHEGSVDSVEIVKKWKSDPSSMGCKQCESSMHTCKHSDLFDAY